MVLRGGIWRAKPHLIVNIPSKLSLIKCPGMSKAQGESYIGSAFSDAWLDEQSRTELSTNYETTILDWQLQMSLSNG